MAEPITPLSQSANTGEAIREQATITQQNMMNAYNAATFNETNSVTKTFSFSPMYGKNSESEQFVQYNLWNMPTKKDDVRFQYLIESSRNIPTIQVQEYPLFPTNKITQGLDVLAKTISTVPGVVSDQFKILYDRFKKYTAGGQNITDEVENDLMKDLKSYNINGDNTMLTFIETMVAVRTADKRPLNYYYMPLLDMTQPILQHDGNTGWTMNSAAKILGQNKTGNAVKFLTEGMAVETPMNLTWNIADYGTDSKAADIPIMFHLYNSNYETLVNNLLFLSDLSQGPLWHWENLTKFPPNIYKVLLPGYNYHVWSTMSLKITPVGQMRMPPPEIFADQMLAGIKIPGTDQVIPGTTSIYANSKSMMVPDAYKIEIVFSSIFPFNRNTYVSGMGNTIPITVGA